MGSSSAAHGAYRNEVLDLMAGSPRQSVAPGRPAPFLGADYGHRLAAAVERKAKQRVAVEAVNAARTRGVKGLTRVAKDMKRQAFAPIAAHAADSDHQGRVWVKGFTRGDGAEVVGHWRKIAGDRSAQLDVPSRHRGKGDLKAAMDAPEMTYPNPHAALTGAPSLLNMAYDAAQSIKSYVDMVRGKQAPRYLVNLDTGRLLSQVPVQTHGAAITLAGIAMTGSIPATAPALIRNGLPRNTLFTMIGPEGAQNLVKNGLRHHEDWGGPDRLIAAAQERYHGVPAADVFQKHGWSDEAFGEKTPWYTVISDSGADLVSLGGVARPVAEQLHHPLLFAAEPRLADLHASLAAGPSLLAQGKTIRNDGSRLFRNMFPRATEAYAFEADAPDRRQLLLTLLHETQHGVAHYQRLPQGGNTFSALRRSDTPEVVYAAEKVARAIAAGASDSDLDVRLLRESLESAERYSGYWNLLGEKTARAVQVKGGRNLPETTPLRDDVIDVYDMSAIIDGYDKSMFRPFTVPEPRR